MYGFCVKSHERGVCMAFRVLFEAIHGGYLWLLQKIARAHFPRNTG